jgi:B12-binding domain/radical SAM domain protein
MASKEDLVLLHAPAVYDFRKLHILYGPIADGIPSTPIFEMYPIGFFSIVECLEKNGFRVRIVNLAARMLMDRGFDAEGMIASLDPKAFGIDLHWLPHAHGSIEVAKLCKRHHPSTPVIFGGYSSTYFHEELMTYPEVDYIVRGDSTEEPLLELIKVISKKSKTPLSDIPNLTWKGADGRARANPLSHVPDELRYVNNYMHMFKHALRHGDIKSLTPFQGWSYLEWFGTPVVPILTCRGCHNNCVFCGGSKKGIQKYCNRTRPAIRPPGQVVQDIAKLKRYTKAPLFVIGDILHLGREYGYALLDGLKRLSLKNLVVLELFDTAPEGFFDKMSGSVENFAFEISPETHDERIRKLIGKRYGNSGFEENVLWALERGAQRVEAFFMIGMPEQTRESVMESVEYCGRLMGRFDARFVPYIFPYAPFVDPGCIAFEEAERYGYKLLFKTLEDYRRASASPVWKYALSYETKWLSRDDIVDCSYRAGLRLNELKLEHGVIDEATFDRTKKKIGLAIEITEMVDGFMEKGDEKGLKDRLERMRPELDMLFDSLLNEKIHKEWTKKKRDSVLKKVFARNANE